MPTENERGDTEREEEWEMGECSGLQIDEGEGRGTDMLEPDRPQPRSTTAVVIIVTMARSD